MLLREMFSPIGAPKDETEEINWLDDLKFYIDNDDKMLNRYFFPAVKRHKEHKGNPNAFKVYIRPIEHCLDHYCQKYDIDDREKKFPKEKLIDLARHFAEDQEKFIGKGDYE
jgi:hypothetical protein|tara:strand:+ start:4760 stop:5095 length:336 start_codon:yes stop_codon:yes gene_type:complete